MSISFGSFWHFNFNLKCQKPKSLGHGHCKNPNIHCRFVASKMATKLHRVGFACKGAPTPQIQPLKNSALKISALKGQSGFTGCILWGGVWTAPWHCFLRQREHTNHKASPGGEVVGSNVPKSRCLLRGGGWKKPVEKIFLQIGSCSISSIPCRA